MRRKKKENNSGKGARKIGVPGEMTKKRKEGMKDSEVNHPWKKKKKKQKRRKKPFFLFFYLIIYFFYTDFFFGGSSKGEITIERGSSAT